MEKTPWFDCSTPPVRIGVYEREFPGVYKTFFQLWNGTRWNLSSSSKLMAGRHALKSAYQSGKWRGILKGTK